VGYPILGDSPKPAKSILSGERLDEDGTRRIAVSIFGGDPAWIFNRWE
jgi:hypothetical protein